MKSIFALVLGTIVLLLAITAQDSPGAQILLAAMGLALCAVALRPRAARDELKASWQLKPRKPESGEFSDSLFQPAPTSRPGDSHRHSLLNYRTSIPLHPPADPEAPNLPLPQRMR
ncbi:hypothetical protein [Halomonas sp.]|uniref:hypothetical protein n=1 Tax=Halomonas sp. TaxID=1486246 RepID=UPI0025BD6783|nr:hypothetical protein [Halomonas sp.]